MSSTILQVLRELGRRHADGGSNPTENSVTDVRAAEVARHLGLSNEEVETALETLVDEQAVARSSLGHYALTAEGLHRSRLV